jgi:hypothetical protein
MTTFSPSRIFCPCSSPPAARLLKKHKQLKALLVVVTKRSGQPAKTLNHKLLIKR